MSSLSVCETDGHGRTAAIGSTGNNAELWDVDEMRRIRVYEGYGNPILCATHDEQYFVTCSSSFSPMLIRVYHIDNGKCLGKISIEDVHVRFVRIIPKSNILLAASSDAVMLYRIPSGELIQRFKLDVCANAFCLLNSMRIVVGDSTTFAVHLFEIPSLQQYFTAATIPVDRFIKDSQGRATPHREFACSSPVSSSSSPIMQNVTAESANRHIELRNLFSRPSEPSVSSSTIALTESIYIDSLPVSEGHRENAVRLLFKAYSVGKRK